MGNALKSLLAAGISAGAGFAGAKLLGSEAGDEYQRQQERNYYNSINGSGPVNARAANSSAKSWTDFFFPSSTPTTNTTMPGERGGGHNWLPLILVLVIGGWIVWWGWKKTA